MKRSSVVRRDGGVGPPRIGIRQHVEDALWRVFAAAKPGTNIVLEQLRDALAAPAFPIFLGRREFPLALPMDPVMNEGGLSSAAEAYPVVPEAPEIGIRPPLAWVLDDLRRLIERHDQNGFRLSWDDGFPGAPELGFACPVVDDPASRSAWRFRPRIEAWTTIRPVLAATLGTESDISFFSSAEEE